MPGFEFHSEDLSRLRRLTFAARLPVMLRHEGEHRTRRSGEGLEFLDYRPYVLGDDLRYIDWNLYGRLRQLIVRVFESQENLSITILVDISRSMSFGNPVSKSTHACRIACALAYVALSRGERLSVATFGMSLNPLLGPLHRKEQLNLVIGYLRQSETSPTGRLDASMRSFCGSMRHKGLVIVISDFLVPEGYSSALRMLLSRGCKLFAIQILDRLDLGTGLNGHLRIRDSETGEEQLILVDEAMRQSVQGAAMTYCEALEAFCRNYHQTYVRTFTHDDYLEVVCHTLRSRIGLP